jgi:hypothetical protein
MSVCNLHLNLATRKRICSPIQVISPFVCEFYPGYAENLLQIPAAGKNNPCKKLKMMEQQSGGGGGGDQDYHTSHLRRRGTMATRNPIYSLPVCALLKNLNI